MHLAVLKGTKFSLEFNIVRSHNTNSVDHQMTFCTAHCSKVCYFDILSVLLLSAGKITIGELQAAINAQTEK